MSMTVNLLAVLLSLAMMLTGAGADGQPAEASRTLVLHNVSVSHNVDAVELAPELRLGVCTDGEKAVYDFRVALDGETLLPMQLGVDESGVTALAVKSGAAVNVTAGALEAAMAQLSGMLEGAVGEAGGENAELMQFLSQEFIPAYVELLKAAGDEGFREEMKALSEGLYEEMIDRGEGAPVTEMIEGEEYALTEYAYTIDNDQMIDIAEAVYAGSETLNNYYEALFKLYAMLPEESGLNGVASFRDLFERTGMRMSLDVVEKLSDDGTVHLSDVQMTLDMSGMAAAMQQLPAPEGETAPEVVELPPMVIDIHSAEIDGFSDATMTYTYEVEGNAVDMSMHITEREGGVDLEMTMVLSEQGEEIGSMSGILSCAGDLETGGSYNMSCGLVAGDRAQVNFGASGSSAGDGTCVNSVSIDVAAQGETYALSFDLDVVPDAIEDLANGHEAALVIGDLSEEGLNALTGDERLSAIAMQAVGSLSLDAQKLMNDESVQQLVTLVGGLMAGEEEPATEPDEDGDYEFMIDGVDDGNGAEFDYGDGDYGYEEVEDDGELGFEVPEFTWLPEGWSVLETNQDTAYDWADVTVGDGTGNNQINAVFFAENEDDVARYVVSSDGSVASLEGIVIDVGDFGEGSLSITLHEADLYSNLIYTSDSVDMETVGRIVAGLKF